MEIRAKVEIAPRLAERVVAAIVGVPAILAWSSRRSPGPSRDSVSNPLDLGANRDRLGS